ncbi:MAG: hypothetical protein JW735_03765 [Prolixibacteraceae bacterium]|jgi:hypothetical protein|nr:hypothetical protein [Prolixibacteraceae bacterium]
MAKKNNIKQASKHNPFIVPEGYFDTFSERLMERIDQSEKPAVSTSQSAVLRYLKPVLAMVASFTIIFMLIYFPVQLLGPKSLSQNNETISVLPEFMNFYQVNDHAIIQAFEQTDTEHEYDNQFIENMLIASLSEYDLLQLNNNYYEN